MTTSRTSLTLLEQAQAKVESAWEDLLKLYTPLIEYWCRISGIRQGQADDIRANVFGKVATHLATFEHNGRTGAFRNWLRTITRNEIAELPQEEVASSAWLEEISRFEEPAEESLTSETLVLYHAAWAIVQTEFSSRDQEIFRRCAENGERPRDVAEDLGISENIVNSANYRIKKRLRDRFAGEFDS